MLQVHLNPQREHVWLRKPSGCLHTLHIETKHGASEDVASDVQDYIQRMGVADINHVGLNTFILTHEAVREVLAT